MILFSVEPKPKNVLVGISILPPDAFGVKLILPTEFVICKLLDVFCIILVFEPRYNGVFSGIRIDPFHVVGVIN